MVIEQWLACVLQELLSTLSNQQYMDWEAPDHPMALVLVRERKVHQGPSSELQSACKKLAGFFNQIADQRHIWSI